MEYRAFYLHMGVFGCTLNTRGLEPHFITSYPKNQDNYQCSHHVWTIPYYGQCPTCKQGWKNVLYVQGPLYLRTIQQTYSDDLSCHRETEVFCIQLCYFWTVSTLICNPYSLQEPFRSTPNCSVHTGYIIYVCMCIYCVYIYIYIYIVLYMYI